MSRESYYRGKGYSTGEMLSENKVNMWELSDRIPFRFREEDDDEERDEFYGLSEEEALELRRQQNEFSEAAQHPPKPVELVELPDDLEF